VGRGEIYFKVSKKIYTEKNSLETKAFVEAEGTITFISVVIQCVRQLAVLL
jgi:hypothetical protein